MTSVVHDLICKINSKYFILEIEELYQLVS